MLSAKNIIELKTFRKWLTKVISEIVIQLGHWCHHPPPSSATKFPCLYDSTCQRVVHRMLLQLKQQNTIVINSKTNSLIWSNIQCRYMLQSFAEHMGGLDRILLTGNSLIFCIHQCWFIPVKGFMKFYETCWYIFVNNKISRQCHLPILVSP